jgi:DNA polymerase-3 subunit epsilon
MEQKTKYLAFGHEQPYVVEELQEDPMKFCYIDVETGGIDHNQYALLQIAAIFEVGEEEVERFESKLAPFPGDKLHPKALEVNRFTEEQVKEFPNPRDVYHEFVGKLSNRVNKFSKQDKFHFIGYNSHAFFFYPSIDVMILAAQALKDKRAVMPNFRLETVAQVLGISPDKTRLHEAMYDIELTREIYRRLQSIKPPKTKLNSTI